MMRLLKWCSWWLVCIPILAHADPVVINANASGTISPDSIWIYQFGGAAPSTSTGPLPFTLSVQATFDTDAPSYSEFSLPPWLVSQQYAAPASISFTVDGSTYNFTGTSILRAFSQPDSFRVTIGIEHSFYFFDLALTFSSPGQDMSGNPLAQRTLSTADGYSADYSLTSIRSNPDAPGNWEDFGTLDNATLTVMSAVPEPGRAGMLFAGILTLLFAARGRWRALLRTR